jgi:hypothetical protein
MRFRARPFSKALVWLAAALLPVQTVLPDTCGCEKPSQHGSEHRLPNLQPASRHAGCGHHGSACCGESTKHPCACCQLRTASVPGSQPAAGVCRCAHHESPTPTPTGNFRVVKEVLHQANLTTGSSLFFHLLDDPLAPWGFAALPATALDRLSTLCRFLI